MQLLNKYFRLILPFSARLKSDIYCQLHQWLCLNVDSHRSHQLPINATICVIDYDFQNKLSFNCIECHQNIWQWLRFEGPTDRIRKTIDHCLPVLLLLIIFIATVSWFLIHRISHSHQILVQYLKSDRNKTFHFTKHFKTVWLVRILNKRWNEHRLVAHRSLVTAKEYFTRLRRRRRTVEECKRLKLWKRWKRWSRIATQVCVGT